MGYFRDRAKCPIAESVDPAVRIYILFSACLVGGKWHRVLYSLSILESNKVFCYACREVFML